MNRRDLADTLRQWGAACRIAREAKQWELEPRGYAFAFSVRRRVSALDSVAQIATICISLELIVDLDVEQLAMVIAQKIANA